MKPSLISLKRPGAPTLPLRGGWRLADARRKL